MSKKARIILEDGGMFHANAFAGSGTSFAELVFNTSMTGYQEILTDPSYKGQIVLMTYPMIGNYGVNTEDLESKRIHLSGFIVKEYSDRYSNYRATQSLASYLNENGIIGLQGVDTRSITKAVRNKGAMRCVITTEDTPVENLLEQLNEHPSLAGQNLAETVSTQETFTFSDEGPEFKVAVIDCGVKTNILRLLEAASCQVEVFPFDVSSDQILNGGFDGVMVSNGPGDPDAVESVIACLKGLFGQIPIYGICLGHQMIALALGAKTFKMKFGHHGANHPVKNVNRNHVEITSQNHGFCVDRESLPSDVEETHVNLFDGSNAGLRHKKFPLFSVQYHPEAAPGPHDSRYLFDEFVSDMKAFRLSSNNQEPS